MERIIGAAVRNFIEQYCAENRIASIWRMPSVKYADARHPGFRELKTVVTENHFMPDDILPDAKAVISYFLPFSEDVIGGNIKGVQASEQWARSYLLTNAMALGLNDHLVVICQKHGFRAAIPKGVGIQPGIVKSYWSQRHIARLAGHGTFGLNNMLITEQGCSGRFFSVITDLTLPTGDIVADERCLYKRDGSCGICFKRCAAGALTPERFDRWKCEEVCSDTMLRYPGADVCGKCTVGLPCSKQCPKPT